MSRTTTAKQYVGVCYEGGWGNDLTALLVVREEDGWKVVGNHISSSEGWARHDIEEWHYAKVAEDGDTVEWAGLLTVAAIEERFGWAKPEPIP